MKERWIGVRPIRFREDIFGILEAVVNHESMSIEEIREYALKLRLKREDKRQRASQKSISLETKIRKKAKLLTKVEQMIRIFRRTGLIKKEGDVILSTARSSELISKRQYDETRGDALFLEFLVNSPYRTYWLFLKQLWKSREIHIPSSHSKRDTKLRMYVNRIGFPLDVWSFFVLRDFFHNFSLLNYIINESFQAIFPLYEMEEEISDSSMFEYHIKGPDGHVYFWPRPPQEFVENLAEVYLSLTDNKWNRMVELVVLREKYSYRFRTPERQFDILFQQALREEKKYRIVPSVGHIKYHPRSTYIIKALSLPCNKFGLPYSLIRIDVGG